MSVAQPLQLLRPHDPKPTWLKVRAPGSETYLRLKGLMQELKAGHGSVVNVFAREAGAPAVNAR